MAQYTKKTDNNGVVRYKDGSHFVGKDNVPQNIKDALDQNPEGTVIDELGDVVDPTIETDEGSGDDDSVIVKPPVEDESTLEDEPESEEVKQPEKKAAKEATIGNMGFPAKKGKTLSIFSDKPHETVKNIDGILVPLTKLELLGDPAKDIEPKTDAEIIERLKELKKL